MGGGIRNGGSGPLSRFLSCARRHLKLSDPRNHHRKSFTIGNHNFEIAIFAAEVAMKSQCRCRSHISRIGRTIATIRNHNLVVNIFCMETPSKPHNTVGSEIRRLAFRGCFGSHNDFQAAIAVACGL